MIRAKDTERLQKLDMTTYRQLIATRLLVGTGVIIGVAFIAEMVGPDKAKSIALKIMEGWFYFLAVVLGVGTGQYGLQRFSSKEYLGAKPQPATPPSGVSIDTQGGDANVQAPVTADRAAIRPSTVTRAIEDAVGRAVEP